MTNTIRTLRALYVLVDHGIRVPPARGSSRAFPSATQVKAKITEVIRIVTPYYL